MTTVKSLAIIALLFGGTSLAMAQNGPAIGGEPPVGGGAGGNPAVTGTHVLPPHHPLRRHRIYMHAPVSTHHKRLETGQPLPKQPKQAQ
jgi:hypothetical protein